MIADRIVREVEIAAPIEVVWSAVSDPEQIKLWFAELDVDVTPGAEGTIRFENGGSDTGRSTHNIRIERVAPPFYLAFRWVYPDGVTPDGTNAPLVEFTLFEESEERTRLKLVESGLKRIDWDDAEKQRFLESHGNGWELYVGRLTAHVLGTAAL